MSAEKSRLADLSSGNAASYEDRVKNKATSAFTADPASFLVVTNILSSVRQSVSEFRLFFSDRPELKTIFEKSLLVLKHLGFIDVHEDKIIVLRSSPFIDLRTSEFEIFPKLLGTIARRIRQNYMDDPKTAFKNSDEFFWRTLPDHPKVRQKLFHLTNKFTAELDALLDEVKDDPTVVAERVRFFSFLCGNLEPEDFK